MKKQQEEMEIENLNRNLLILYYLWKKLSKYCNAQEKVSHPFFNFVPQQLIASKFRKRVQFLNLPTCFSSDSLCFIYFDIIIHQRLKKKPFLRRNNIGLDVKALFASHPLSSKSGDKTNHVIQQNNFEKRLFRCTRLFMD